MARSRELTGRDVLLIAAGGIGVVFIVNIFFVVAALRTHTGVTVGDAYTLGLAYNDQIEAREAQAALGWSYALETGAANTGGLAVSFTLTDADGGPVSGLTVDGHLRRLVEANSDQPISFEEAAPGVYLAHANVNRAGRWQLQLRARRASDGAVYDIGDVIWVP